jgi:hypothetical protein
VKLDDAGGIKGFYFFVEDCYQVSRIWRPVLPVLYVSLSIYRAIECFFGLVHPDVVCRELPQKHTTKYLQGFLQRKAFGRSISKIMVQKIV